MSYEASRHNYEGGRALSTVSTYKPSKSKATMQRVTTQTKATGGGLPTQIDVRGKGAHKKLAKVGLRKSPKK